FMQTRRKFLRDCSVVTAAASFVPTAAFAESRKRPAIPGLQQFARSVRTNFIVRTRNGSMRMQLTEARAFSAMTSDSEDARNEKFVLRFQGSSEHSLEQGTYMFVHPHLGSFSIFIVPVGGTNPTSTIYEAIFDRPVNANDLAAL